ncbi:unnamed protein product [Schistosoma rodhaini]|nr:unnamed protein product [Schistosoma rodhaini]
MVDPLPSTSQTQPNKPFSVDIRDLFERIMRPRHLTSWNQVEEAIDLLQKMTYTHYVVRESKLNKEEPGLHYHYVVYVCTFGHKRKPEGTGQRVKGSKFTGCKSMFRIRYEHNRYIIPASKTVHNHPCDSEYLTNDPWSRKLSQDQLQVIIPMITVSLEPNEIIKYVGETFNKTITLNDYRNLRHKVAKNNQKKRN